MKLMLKPKLLKKYSRRTLIGCGIGFGVLALVGGGAVYAKLGGSAAISSSNDINLQKGLIEWWKLDGNTKDATPYSNDLVLLGTTLPSSTTDRRSRANSAYSFSGSSAMASNTTTKIQGYNLTWSIWFKTSMTTGGHLLGGSSQQTGSTGSSSRAIYMDTTGKVGFGVYMSGAGYAAQSSQSYNDNQWHLATATEDSTGSKLYVDGALVGTTTATITGSYTMYWRVGYDNIYNYPGGSTATSYHFTGSLDDPRIYNRTLSSQEVSALYTQYAPGLKVAQGGNGLVGWWKFDGNAKDASPYADNGTVSGATLTADRKNAANSAYSFNGTSSYIQMPYNSVTRPTSAITVSAWIYTTNNASTAEQRIVSTTETGGYALYLTGSSGNQCIAQQICFIIYQSSSTIQKVQANKSLLANNAWTHIVVTYDASTGILSLFLNGSLTTTNSVGAVPLFYTYSNPLCIGAEASATNCSSSTAYYSGSIDDVRVYNRVLSASDITGLYGSYNSQIELGGSGQSGSISLGKGLIGTWAFNGNAKDATPYSNNGIVSGASLTSDREGQTNSAYNFNGTSNYINVGYSSFTHPTSVSAGAWIYVADNTSTTDQRVLSTTEVGGYALYLTGTASDNCLAQQVCFLVVSNSNYRYVGASKTLLANNAWNYLAATYDATTGASALYINGSLVANTNFGAGSITYTNNNPLCIGAEATASSCSADYYSGAIDNVRLWNKPLTASEVKASYQEYQ